MQPILSREAPAPVGPYSQAVSHGGFLFVSGQIPLDPETGKIRGDSIEEQTEQVLRNLEAVLRAAGGGWTSLLRVGVYLVDIQEFTKFNTVYAQVLKDVKPARSTIGVQALPLGAKLEIDAIAAIAS